MIMMILTEKSVRDLPQQCTLWRSASLDICRSCFYSHIMRIQAQFFISLQLFENSVGLQSGVKPINHRNTDVEQKQDSSLKNVFVC